MWTPSSLNTRIGQMSLNGRNVNPETACIWPVKLRPHQTKNQVWLATSVALSRWWTRLISSICLMSLPLIHAAGRIRKARVRKA